MKQTAFLCWLEFKRKSNINKTYDNDDDVSIAHTQWDNFFLSLPFTSCYQIWIVILFPILFFFDVLFSKL